MIRRVSVRRVVESGAVLPLKIKISNYWTEQLKFVHTYLVVCVKLIYINIKNGG